MNACEVRQQWWLDVRTCRRRQQVPLEETALKRRVFSMENEYVLLHFRAVVNRMIRVLHEKKIGVFEIFRAFNASGNGHLTCSELYGGIEWLGLQVDPETIYTLVRNIDTDGDGLVNFDDFQNAFNRLDVMLSKEEGGKTMAELSWRSVMSGESSGTADGGEGSSAPSRSTIAITPKPIKELSEALVKKHEAAGQEVTITADKVARIKVKLVKLTNFVEVWNSKGSMGRSPVSVWAPDTRIGGMMKANRIRVCVGHYVNSSFDNPSKDKKSARMVLELSDTKGYGIMGSSALMPVLAKMMPFPIRYRQVWNQQATKEGGVSFYAWAPIPPSPKFVCLGMIGTATDDPPPLEAVRCVPKVWTVPADGTAVQVWNDSGTAGRPGSMWDVSSLHLAAITQGHVAPKEKLFDLKQESFGLSSQDLAAVE
jgi:hypothetical protein